MPAIMRTTSLCRWLFPGWILLLTFPACAATYYLDADGGSDLNDGSSSAQAWRTLAHANLQSFQPGDQILLRRGDVFAGKILLDGESGSAGSPIVIGSYGDGAKPVINASGYLAGVHVQGAQHIEVRDIEITANGGAMVDGSPEDERYGVLVNATAGKPVRHVTLRNLHIHDVFPSVGKASEGANPTSYFGYGICLRGQSDAQSEQFLITNCMIERTGHRGISPSLINSINIIDNVLTDIGGPGIQPGLCDDVVVRGNVVTRSGSYVDPRMHGRGSGIWPWTCQRVLIERNTFSGARGRADSCGIHIDFNCSHVVVQYNLSRDNAGGFIEILGNGFNNAYRYNISINDASRVKGVVDQGMLANDQDGHIIFISGYTGTGPNTGPTNSYLYNNTVYMKSSIKGAFHIQENARGLLIANNIFYIEGTTFNGTSSTLDDYTQDMINSVVWDNNLYQRAGIIPSSFPFAETGQTIGDPLFANKGGLTAADYIPSATTLIRNQGMVIGKLPGDAIGLQAGLAVTKDFFGSPITGLPDIGAVEIQEVLPTAAFSQAPTALSSGSVTMSAVAAPPEVEYYFEETSGNFGGSDSGWQSGSTYTDAGLLPNTTYTYVVKLRDSMDVEKAPSSPTNVRTPASLPLETLTLFSEDFSGVTDPANSASPYPAGNWYALDEAQAASVAVTSGQLQVGWGYDTVTTLYRCGHAWNLVSAYRYRGDWTISTVLDLHQGIVVGIGEFDATTGALLRRVKGVTVGNLSNPSVGQSGSFLLDLSAQEIAAAGVNAASRIGLFIDHPGALTPNRNDVYLVDNLQLETIGAMTDTDGDGIGDADEVALGLNPSDPADAGLNADGDAYTNVQEYRMGTNPSNGSSFLQPGIELSGGNASIRLPQSQIRTGRWYIHEISDDLRTWSVPNAVRGADVSGDLIFNLPPGNKSFARIRVEWSD